MSSSVVGTLILTFILVSIMLCFFGFCIYMIVSPKRAFKKQQAFFRSKGIINGATYKHVAGLPIPEGALCNVYEYNDLVEIESGNSKFNLMIDKIIDIVIVHNMIAHHGHKPIPGPIHLVFTYVSDDAIKNVSFYVNTNLAVANHLANSVKSRLTLEASVDL